MRIDCKKLTFKLSVDNKIETVISFVTMDYSQILNSGHLLCFFSGVTYLQRGGRKFYLEEVELKCSDPNEDKAFIQGGLGVFQPPSNVQT